MTGLFYRCTFEWDTIGSIDDRGDKHYVRHICMLPMHHAGKHRSASEIALQKRKWSKKEK